MNPKELAAQLRKPEGQQGIETGKSMNDGNKYMYSFTYSLLNLRDPDTILEIGFGNGKFIQDLLSVNKCQYSGIDFSETMVKEAIDLNQELIRQERAEIQKANLSSIPYPDEKFDKVFTINTLYFWKNPRKDILEISRVLKTGGKLFITIRPKSIVQHLEFTKHGFTLYEADDVKALMESGGFSDINWKLNEEPEFEIQGQKVKLKGLCVFGTKK